jgi:hypothetical protein
MNEKDAKIIELATKHLPPLEGVAVSELRAVRVERSYSSGVHPHEVQSHVVAFVGHPEYGDEEILAYLTQTNGALAANWGYGCHEVNGVAYRTRTEANRVRRALADAGIPHVYPGCKEGIAALRAAGIDA